MRTRRVLYTPEPWVAYPETEFLMQKVLLGKTGLEVTRLGAGLSQIGLKLDSSQFKQAGQALNAYLDAGVNFLDTAPCYRQSQAAIGEFVSHRRDEYVLATKAGHHPDGYHLLTGRPWSGPTIRESIERSLRTLRTDYVDILQLHSPVRAVRAVLERGEAVEELLKLKAEGKTRFIGLSGEGGAAAWAVENPVFDTLQTTYNLIDQASGPIIEKAAALGMGVIIKRPVANAVWGRTEPPLAGEGDWGEFGAMVGYQQRYLSMTEEGQLPGAPDDPVELAMGFVLSNENVHTAIVGSQNPAHIQDNVDMVERGLSLAPAVMADLQRRHDDVGWFWDTLG
jgi:aryl-alcohol dehydrogenase-like predicted oxidoreductase